MIARVSITLLLSSALIGCASFRPPEITYDDVPPAARTPQPVADDKLPEPLHTPPAWTPARGGSEGDDGTDAGLERVALANTAARVEPRRAGYFNAVQVFSYSPGALYQVYAAPGHVTEIALEPGETLTGPGPIAAGDTVRWVIGDTISGTGRDERVHILVKPTRTDIVTNLVVNTDRRTYHMELRSGDETYMASVAWAYPPGERQRARPRPPAEPIIPPPSERLFRYALSGDTPPWRPAAVFDDRSKVYVVFPRGIGQGELPPLMILGPDGEPQLANTRVWRNVMIVDRLFGSAELRLGGEEQQIVRIVRTDGRPQS